MYKTWKKMKKAEKLACTKDMIIKGIGVFLFGAVWTYFTARAVDAWNALPQTIAVMGLLVLLYGLYKRSSL